jgi:UPF0716 protein FxsA
MFLLFISFVVIAPLVELYFIVQVGQSIGLLPTIALLIAISAVGTSLIKREGIKVYRDFVATIRRGEEPAEQIVHGVCLLAAGVLMLAPGFLSDIVSLTLLVPPIRRLIAAIVLRRSTRRITVIRATHSGPNVETRGTIASTSYEVIDVDPHEEGDTK